MGILDTVLDKTKELKNEYDRRKRAEKEDRLNIKEVELKTKEKALADKERELQTRAASLSKREKEVLRKARRPLYVLLMCLLLSGAFVGWAWHNYKFTKRAQPEIRSSSATDNKSEIRDTPSPAGKTTSH
jgi:cytoskeletal protein RodZ